MQQHVDQFCVTLLGTPMQWTESMIIARNRERNSINTLVNNTGMNLIEGKQICDSQFDVRTQVAHERDTNTTNVVTKSARGCHPTYNSCYEWV